MMFASISQAANNEVTTKDAVKTAHLDELDCLIVILITFYELIYDRTYAYIYILGFSCLKDTKRRMMCTYSKIGT